MPLLSYSPEEMKPLNGLLKLQNTLAQLRDPKDGCPWDLAQSHESLLPYFLEELHEFQDCVLNEKPDNPHFQEELGDLLFQVLFHFQLLGEKTGVQLDEVASKVADKLIHRHPHVFDKNGPKLSRPEEVEAQWEKRKSLEKSHKKSISERLNDIPKGLPALQRAQRLGEKASSLGFDWRSDKEIWSKIKEEILEFEQATNDTHAQEEFGDILFVLTQLSRKKGWSSEIILTKANDKFTKRMSQMETLINKRQLVWEKLNVDELEMLWQEVKKIQTKDAK
ncbi:MAG: nucleoside triphosphate pyrophosphohydrolase [Proteobacteria bacterium]|nr:nucleoside triphosphate pyrophosphohydrolase [Pseudomonadota bacterium]